MRSLGRLCAFMAIGSLVSLLAQHPGLEAKLALADGTTQMVRLQGVGCSVSMCSRTMIRSTADRGSVQSTQLNQIAAIHDTSDGQTEFVMKDGSARRLAIVPENRYLYFERTHGAPAKVDLGHLKSLEFVGSAQ